MPKSFWEVCREYCAEIMPSYYPIKFNYAECEEIAKGEGVKFHPHLGGTKKMRKAYSIRPHGETGSRIPTGKRNFLNCSPANVCINLKNGRLYPCNIAPHAVHLKKYFNLDIQLSKEDGVDIYAVKSGEELMKKLANPIPFCKYCDILDPDAYVCDWGVSHKDRYEWLAFEFTDEDIHYLETKKPDVYIFGAGVWGRRAVALLKRLHIPIQAVLATRTHGIDNLLGVPIVTLDNVGKVAMKSICLVALASSSAKEEVYPLLSQMGFGDVVPLSGTLMYYQEDE